MLTRKQHNLLMLIHKKMSKEGIPPSYEEMKEALDLRSKSGIHRLIVSLEERGFIRRMPYRARAIEVVRLPGEKATVDPNFLANDRARFSSIGNEGASIIPFAQEAPDRTRRDVDSVRSIPLVGQIAAGTPIEALQHNHGHISVPASLLGSGEYYALEIKGDSMVEEGILNGDTAIIRHSDTADDGTIVVALVNDIEATLKRIRYRGDMIELHAANPAYEMQTLSPDKVRVQGRLAGLVRRY